MGTYGQPKRWARLYRQVTAEARDLRGQLEALVQARDNGADPADVQAVRAALWAAHRKADG